MNARKPIGAAVMLAGLAAFAWGLFHLIQTGSCAGGGPYVIARECPEGTGLKATALTLGVLVALVGALAAGVGMGVVPLIFMTVGGASIASANLGDVPEGMGAFPYAFGVPFLVMGLLWLLATVGLKRYFRSPSVSPDRGPPGRPKTPLFGAKSAPLEAAPVSVPPPSPAPAPETPQPLARLEQLERLAALEKSGAITSAEFERMKTEILAQQ